VAISLKRVKIDSKSYYGRPIGTHQRSFERYHPRPLMAPFPQDGVCNLATSLISGTGKATDCKFGGYIYTANPNRSPLKILEKRKRGHIQGLPNFWVPSIILEMGKATDFKFCKNIHRVHRNKSP